MLHDRDVFDTALRRLQADASTEFGQPGARIEHLRRIDGRFSSVLRVRIRTPTRSTTAYIKILKPYGNRPEDLARADRMLAREYRATRALYEALAGDADFGVVRPIAFLPEQRTIVTEEVAGRPFGELLVDPRSTADELAAIAGRVGAWVRRYQATVTGTSAVNMVDIDERRHYLAERLDTLEGRVLTPADRVATLARFDSLRRDIGVSAVPAVPIHADLTPLNIIVDASGRPAVLDFTMAKTGTIFHDLSHVSFHLELLAARHRRQAALMRHVQRALLSGYGPDTSADHPLFRLMMLQHGVCHVALMAERQVPILDAAYRWFMRRRWRTCERMPAHVGEPQVA